MAKQRHALPGAEVFAECGSATWHRCGLSTNWLNAVYLQKRPGEYAHQSLLGQEPSADKTLSLNIV